MGKHELGPGLVQRLVEGVKVEATPARLPLPPEIHARHPDPLEDRRGKGAVEQRGHEVVRALELRLTVAEVAVRVGS